MTSKGENAFFELVIPPLDFEVISPRYEHGLLGVEVDASNGSLMFLEGIDKGSYFVVPELNNPVVQTGKDPGTTGMEGNSLDALAFGLKFRQHNLDLKILK